MIKVYFAQNWGLTSRQMCENYIKQTPGCLGAWENIQVTYDIDDADYLIIEDKQMLSGSITKQGFISHEKLWTLVLM